MTRPSFLDRHPSLAILGMYGINRLGSEGLFAHLFRQVLNGNRADIDNPTFANRVVLGDIVSAIHLIIPF